MRISTYYGTATVAPSGVHGRTTTPNPSQRIEPLHRGQTGSPIVAPTHVNQPVKGADAQGGPFGAHGRDGGPCIAERVVTFG